MIDDPHVPNDSALSSPHDGIESSNYIADSVNAMARRTQRFLSPWVQRMFLQDEGRSSARGKKSGPLASHRSTAFSTSGTLSLVHRADSTTERSTAFKVDIGRFEPERMDRFASSIIDRFPSMAAKYEPRGAESDKQEPNSLPLPDSAPLPGIPGTDVFGEGSAPDTEGYDEEGEADEAVSGPPMPSFRELQELTRRAQEGPELPAGGAPVSSRSATPPSPVPGSTAATPAPTDPARPMMRQSEIDEVKRLLAGESAPPTSPAPVQQPRAFSRRIRRARIEEVHPDGSVTPTRAEPQERDVARVPESPAAGLPARLDAPSLPPSTRESTEHIIERSPAPSASAPRDESDFDSSPRLDDEAERDPAAAAAGYDTVAVPPPAPQGVVTPEPLSRDDEVERAIERIEGRAAAGATNEQKAEPSSESRGESNTLPEPGSQHSQAQAERLPYRAASPRTSVEPRASVESPVEIEESTDDAGMDRTDLTAISRSPEGTEPPGGGNPPVELPLAPRDGPDSTPAIPEQMPAEPLPAPPLVPAAPTSPDREDIDAAVASVEHKSVPVADRVPSRPRGAESLPFDPLPHPPAAVPQAPRPAATTPQSSPPASTGVGQRPDGSVPARLPAPATEPSTASLPLRRPRESESGARSITEESGSDDEAGPTPSLDSPPESLGPARAELGSIPAEPSIPSVPIEDRLPAVAPEAEGHTFDIAPFPARPTTARPEALDERVEEAIQASEAPVQRATMPPQRIPEVDDRSLPYRERRLAPELVETPAEQIPDSSESTEPQVWTIRPPLTEAETTPTNTRDPGPTTPRQVEPPTRPARSSPPEQRTTGPASQANTHEMMAKGSDEPEEDAGSVRVAADSAPIPVSTSRESLDDYPFLKAIEPTPAAPPQQPTGVTESQELPYRIRQRPDDKVATEQIEERDPAGPVGSEQSIAPDAIQITTESTRSARTPAVSGNSVRLPASVDTAPLSTTPEIAIAPTSEPTAQHNVPSPDRPSVEAAIGTVESQPAPTSLRPISDPAALSALESGSATTVPEGNPPGSQATVHSQRPIDSGGDPGRASESPSASDSPSVAAAPIAERVALPESPSAVQDSATPDPLYPRIGQDMPFRTRPREPEPVDPILRSHEEQEAGAEEATSRVDQQAPAAEPAAKTSPAAQIQPSNVATPAQSSSLDDAVEPAATPVGFDEVMGSAPTVTRREDTTNAAVAAFEGTRAPTMPEETPTPFPDGGGTATTRLQSSTELQAPTPYSATEPQAPTPIGSTAPAVQPPTESEEEKFPYRVRRRQKPDAELRAERENEPASPPFGFEPAAPTLIEIQPAAAARQTGENASSERHEELPGSQLSGNLPPSEPLSQLEARPISTPELPAEPPSRITESPFTLDRDEPRTIITSPSVSSLPPSLPSVRRDVETDLPYRARPTSAVHHSEIPETGSANVQTSAGDPTSVSLGPAVNRLSESLPGTGAGSVTEQVTAGALPTGRAAQSDSPVGEDPPATVDIARRVEEVPFRTTEATSAPPSDSPVRSQADEVPELTYRRRGAAPPQDKRATDEGRAQQQSVPDWPTPASPPAPVFESNRITALEQLPASDSYVTPQEVEAPSDESGRVDPATPAAQTRSEASSRDQSMVEPHSTRPIKFETPTQDELPFRARRLPQERHPVSRELPATKATSSPQSQSGQEERSDVQSTDEAHHDTSTRVPDTEAGGEERLQASLTLTEPAAETAAEERLTVSEASIQPARSDATPGVPPAPADPAPFTATTLPDNETMPSLQRASNAPLSLRERQKPRTREGEPNRSLSTAPSLEQELLDRLWAASQLPLSQRIPATSYPAIQRLVTDIERQVTNDLSTGPEVAARQRSEDQTDAPLREAPAARTRPPLTTQEAQSHLLVRGWRFKSKEAPGAADPRLINRAIEHLESSQDSGRPLAHKPRTMMEKVMGRDFGEVRIRTAPLGALNAKAAARGRDIYFEEGQDRFDTPESLSLLGHELTHVAQSGMVQAKPKRHTAVLPQARVQRVEADEAEADQNEQSILRALRTGGESLDLAMPPGISAPSIIQPSSQPQIVTRVPEHPESSQLPLVSHQSAQGTPIQRQPDGMGTQGGSSTVQRALEDSNVEVRQTDETTMPAAPDLDALARQIYPIIKRMLAIERERRPHRLQ